MMLLPRIAQSINTGCVAVSKHAHLSSGVFADCLQAPKTRTPLLATGWRGILRQYGPPDLHASVT
eukprot:15455790-Alexandrium_andersonii.AAC.1